MAFGGDYTIDPETNGLIKFAKKHFNLMLQEEDWEN